MVLTVLYHRLNENLWDVNDKICYGGRFVMHISSLKYCNKMPIFTGNTGISHNAIN